MGQAPSAIPSLNEDEGEDDAVFCSGGTGIGCLPAPRFLRKRRVIVFEDYDYDVDDEGDGGELAMTAAQCATMAVAALERPCPPEELVLTDVEGEDDEEEDDTGGHERTPKRGGGWLPDLVASELSTATPAVPAEELPPPPLPIVSELSTTTAAVPAESENPPPPPQPPPEEGRKDIDDDTVIPEDVLAKLVAVDCGMVGSHHLRRVCIVDGHGAPLLSALVRVVDETITSCWYYFLCNHPLAGKKKRPRINGNGDNLDLGVPASEIREEAASLLRGKIVVGHHVEGDLTVLGLGKRGRKDEPRKGRDFEVRDTATYPPFMTPCTRGNGRPRMAKLRDLAQSRLDRKIQLEGQFHCCEEDAVAALDLYKSVWHEWESTSKRSSNTYSAKPMQRSNTNQQRSNSSPGQRTTKVNKQKKKRKKKGKKQQRRKPGKKKKQQNGTRGSTGIAIARSNRTTESSSRRGKMKRSKKAIIWWKTYHYEDFLLACHCLLETWCVLLSCVGWSNIPRNALGWNDIAAALNSSKGAITMSMVGLNVFCMSSKHRNEKESVALFGMLARYRCIGALARIISWSCATVTELRTTPVVAPLRRMALAMARQIMFATPMAFVDPVPIFVHRATSIARTDNGAGYILNQFVSLLEAIQLKHLNIAGLSLGCFPIICEVVLSFWFALRATKKFHCR